MFAREAQNNAPWSIEDVPRSLTTVAWYWQCERGHRWRSPMNDMYRTPANSRRPYRWQRVAGKRSACRFCVLEDYSPVFLRCGHREEDLSLVSRIPLRIDDWCSSCRMILPDHQPGDAIRVQHDPPTSKAERTLRALLEQSLPLATPGEANAVAVESTSWGAQHVFPDMLVPSRRIAIEYDSAGRFGTDHGPASIDADKDASLRAVGWEVIRVRTGGLAKLGPFDVIASGPTRRAAAAVIAAYEDVLRSRDE